MTSDEDALDSLSAHVSAELSVEFDRKNSLDTRAVAVVSANLALVTLYFALAAQKQFTVDLDHSGVRTCTWTALVASLLSLLIGLISALPAPYAATETAAFLDTLADVQDGMPAADVKAEVIEAQVEQLRTASHLNDWKAALAFVSFVAFSVAVAFFAAALVLGLV